MEVPNIKVEAPKLSEALAKAQGEFKTIVTNCEANVRMKNGGTYSFKYADLNAIMGATQAALTKNGLSITTHLEDYAEDKIKLTVALRHLSGEFLPSSIVFRQPAERPQDLGSLISYFRRYLLCPLINVSASEDDDARIVSGENEYKEHSQPQPKEEISPEALGAKKPLVKNNAPIGKSQAERIAYLLTERQISTDEFQYWMKYCYGGANARTMTRHQAEEIVSLLSDVKTTVSTVMDLAEAEKAAQSSKQTKEA